MGGKSGCLRLSTCVDAIVVGMDTDSGGQVFFPHWGLRFRLLTLLGIGTKPHGNEVRYMEMLYTGRYNTKQSDPLTHAHVVHSPQLTAPAHHRSTGPRHNPEPAAPAGALGTLSISSWSMVRSDWSLNTNCRPSGCGLTMRMVTCTMSALLVTAMTL